MQESAGTHDVSSWNEPLISREELTGTLFAIADIRGDVREIRGLLSEDGDGEDAEEAT